MGVNPLRKLFEDKCPLPISTLAAKMGTTRMTLHTFLTAAHAKEPEDLIERSALHSGIKASEVRQAWLAARKLAAKRK